MKLYRWIVFLVILNFAIAGSAQNIAAPYEVGTWKGFAKAAITYTFDDNCSNQYSVAIPMLNEFDFDGTFFPVINWGPKWDLFEEAVNQGHEIGSHTVSHRKLSELSETEQEEELQNSIKEINTNIKGQTTFTIAYPYCDPGKQSICEKYFIGARHCQGHTEKNTPDNFMTISSIACGKEGSVKTLDNFINTAGQALSTNGWCVYLIHGIDDDGGYSSLESSVLRQSLEYFDNNSDKFWVTTFGNAVKYIKERNCVSLEVIETLADTIKIKVSDILENEIYNYPVSFRRPLPESWTNAVVKQNNTSVDYKVYTLNSLKYIEFNVIPDNGVITLIKSDEVLNSAIYKKKGKNDKSCP